MTIAAQGARVLAVDVDAKGADGVVREIEGAGGVAVAVVGDLGEQSVVDEVVPATADIRSMIPALFTRTSTPPKT